MRKVVKAIIFQDNKYLLQLRDCKREISYPNHWCFFGGGVQDSESDEKALKREVFEEIYWKPKEIKYYKKSKDESTNCIISYYLVRFDSYHSKLKLNEGQSMKWFLLEEMVNLIKTPSNMLEMLDDNNFKKILSSF